LSWVGEYITTRNGIICIRIQKSYDTNKYTKIYGRGRCKSNAIDKAIKLFQTMVIMNLNMGNLNLEVSSLKNRLMIKEKEKVVLHVELDKERDFQKEYKNNIEIWRKNRTKNKQRVKALIQKLQDENKELKVKTTLMKS
jgi:chromosome segregation ATPase